MNDNRRRDVDLIQQAIDMRLTLAELRVLVAKREAYRALKVLIALKEGTQL